MPIWSPRQRGAHISFEKVVPVGTFGTALDIDGPYSSLSGTAGVQSGTVLGMAQIESNPGVGLNAAVAAELRAERAAQRMTVDALAHVAGISKGSLLRYLKPSRHINIDTLEELAHALGTTSEEIVAAAKHRLAREDVNAGIGAVDPSSRARRVAAG